MESKRKVMVLDAVLGKLEEKEIVNNFKAIQYEVGGNFEIPYLDNTLNKNGIDTYINEDGKFLTLPISACILDEEDTIQDVIMGNVLFSTHDEKGDTISLSDKQVEVIRDICKNQVLIGPSLNELSKVVGFKI